MRLRTALLHDMRYQAKYGFYLLYLFFSVLYIVALLLCPPAYQKTVASIIVLTDPAMLGSVFIGGIWLLEKSEGLHSYWGVSPLRPLEYILSKAVSLAMISTVSADLIVWIGLRGAANYLMLSTGILVGSMIFTTIGLCAASYAHSVNHYMLLVSPLEIFIALPVVFVMFGISHPVLDLLPGIALWRIIGNSIGIGDGTAGWRFIVLALWLGCVVCLACRRIPKAMQTNGSETK